MFLFWNRNGSSFVKIMVQLQKGGLDILRRETVIYTHINLCQRYGFVLFTDKAASAEGARNERFSASKVCRSGSK